MGDSNGQNIVMPGGVQGASFINVKIQGISLVTGTMDVRSGAEAASNITIEYTEGNTKCSTTTTATTTMGDSNAHNIVEAGGFQGAHFENRTLNNVVINFHVAKKTEEKKKEETKEEAKEEKKDEEKPGTTEKTEEKAPKEPTVTVEVEKVEEKTESTESNEKTDTDKAKEE